MSPSVLDIFDRVTVMESYAARLSDFKISSCNIDTSKNSIALYLVGRQDEELLSVPDTKSFIDMTKRFLRPAEL